MRNLLHKALGKFWLKMSSFDVFKDLSFISTSQKSGIFLHGKLPARAIQVAGQDLFP